jgi:hypothetical protein
MWKKAHILYLIIIYRQIIWFWGGLARLERLEYLTENSFNAAGQVITLFTQFRPDYLFLFSMKQSPEFFSKFCVARLFILITKTVFSGNSKCFHHNGFEMYILIEIYTVCTCDALVATRILNSEISWFCFDFPKRGPVSFIITDFNVFVQFFE